MAKHRESSSLVQLFSTAAGAGFRRAYSQVQVDERKYLRHLQRAHRLPIESWQEMFHLGPQVLDPIAAGTIKSASRMAALEGAGLGLGGFLTVAFFFSNTTVWYHCSPQPVALHCSKYNL